MGSYCRQKRALPTPPNVSTAAGPSLVLFGYAQLGGMSSDELPQDQPIQLINGHFTNAHHVILNNPDMHDITNVHYHMGFDSLQLMNPFVIKGVEFDSSERHPLPRCYPGTRQDIVSAILTWRNNNDRLKCLLWLNGPAGIGKSTIIQALAEAEAGKTSPSRSTSMSAGTSKIGATLFISRSKKRNDSNRVLATIIYQLAVKDPVYRAYITRCMTADPRTLDKPMTEQFKLFITQPFGELSLWHSASEYPDARSIYLDGLDECNSEGAQCQLVELIGAFTLQYPRAPLVWIIASRPENHLQELFMREDILPTYHQVTIPINSVTVCRDVGRYLHTELTKIKYKHPNLIPSESPWPTESQFLELGQAASGLFAFASPVINFVDVDPAPQVNPITQLMLILAIIRQARPSIDFEENPFATLDLLYHQIMSSVPPTILHVTKRLLGFAIYDVVHITTLAKAANIIGLDQHTVYRALAKLPSVINVPTPEDATSSKVTVLHASFADYLKDPRRSGEYCVDITEFHTVVWHCFFRILREFNESGKSEGAVTLTWDHPKWQEQDTFYMIQNARTAWIRMFLSTYDGFRMYSKKLQIHISMAEQADIFDTISFHKLDRYTSAIISDDLVNFLLWMRYYSPQDIRKKLTRCTIEGTIFDCARILNRVANDWISYEIVWWPRATSVKWNLIGFWGQASSHEWDSHFRPDGHILGTTDELVRKMKTALRKRGKSVKAVVLGGWYAILEEREFAKDGSMKVYILRLSERLQ